MTFHKRPPRPDAFQTFVEQLRALHDGWGRDVEKHHEPGSYAHGVRDTLRKAQGQIKWMIETAELARKEGIYVTDAQQLLIELIRRNHEAEMSLIESLARKIADIPLPRRGHWYGVEDADGTITGLMFKEDPPGHWEYREGPVIGGTPTGGMLWVEESA